MCSLCNLAAHYDLNRDPDHLSCILVLLAHMLVKHGLSLFPCFAGIVDASEAGFLTVLGWAEGLRVYLCCIGGWMNPYFVNSPHPIISTGVSLQSLPPCGSSFLIFPHLWLALRWVCALRSMAVCGFFRTG